MIFCTHFNSEVARMKKTPLAVPFGWFMLGLLLFVSFEGIAISAVALVLMLFNGFKLLKRANLVVCCMRKRTRAIERTGEDPGNCLLTEERSW